VLVQLGDFDQARRTLARGIELADEIGSRQRRGHAELHLAELALLENDPVAARCWVERGMTTGRAIGDVHSEREGFPILAEALVELGDIDAAEDAARRGLEIAVGGGFVLSVGRNRYALARALAAGSRLPDAEAELAEAERIFRESDARVDLARTLVLRATLLPRAETWSAVLDEASTIARAAGARTMLERAVQARRSSG
jgi:hypothetical protein